MTKKYVEIKINKKPVFVAAVEECDPLTFIKKEREAFQNLNDLIEGSNQKNDALEERIKTLEDEIKILKGED